jgi:ABC-2 type transport system ATP-binding protein
MTTTAFPPRPAGASQPSEPAVALSHVTKTFGEHTAVDDLSLVVPTGSCYGFIGPNGSGKTTTLRMIMRILEQDQGEVTVLGNTDTTRPDDRVGYLPEERGLYKQMKVRDVLRFYAAIKGADASRKTIDDWLARLGLEGWENKKVEQLSKGMSQKVQFIATVLSRPRLVLLDEVFSGLDPVNRETMTEQILELRRDGVTVIFSTHDMAVAEQMCDRIFMIYKGRKVLDGTLAEIRHDYGMDTLRVDVEGIGAPEMQRLTGVAGVRDLGQVQELRLDTGADEQQVLAELMQRGRVRCFEVKQPSLQDIFIRIARPQAEDLAAAEDEMADAVIGG